MRVLSNEELTRRIESLEDRLDYIKKILDDNQLSDMDDDEDDLISEGYDGGEFYK